MTEIWKIILIVEKMKVITVKQPHASLIIEGVEADTIILIKDIENRTWKTNFRGRVLIHDMTDEQAAKEYSFNMKLNKVRDDINSKVTETID